LRRHRVNLAAKSQAADLGDNDDAASPEYDQTDKERRNLADQHGYHYRADEPLLTSLAEPIERLGDHHEPDQPGGDERRGECTTHRLPQCPAKLATNGASPSTRTCCVAHDTHAERGQQQDEARVRADASPKPPEHHTTSSERATAGGWFGRDPELFAHSRPANTKVRAAPIFGR
jgi:hypothetical protein